MRKFLKEFRDFILRGNVLNLAVGVIIGGAFQAIVSSLTADILAPIIGLFTRQSFDSWEWTIVPGVDLKYGAFITNVFNFIIMAFIVFLIVKLMNKIMSINKKPEAPAEPTTHKCPFCMTEIDINATRCPACTSILKTKPQTPHDF